MNAKILSFDDLEKQCTALIAQFPELPDAAVPSPFKLLLDGFMELKSNQEDQWANWKELYEDKLNACDRIHPGLKEIFEEFNSTEKEQSKDIKWPQVTADNNERLMPEVLIEVLHKLKIEQERVIKDNPKGMELAIAHNRVKAIKACREKLLYGPASPTAAQLKEELSNLQKDMTSTKKHKVKFGMGFSISMQSLFGKWTDRVTGRKKIGEIIDFVEKSKVVPAIQNKKAA